MIWNNNIKLKKYCMRIWDTIYYSYHIKYVIYLQKMEKYIIK